MANSLDGIDGSLNDTAEFLINYKENGASFTIKEFGEDKVDKLANLYYKDVIISEENKDIGERGLKGLSLNLDALPSKRLKIA